MIGPVAWAVLGAVLAAAAALTVASVRRDRAHRPGDRAGSPWPFVGGLLALPLLAIAAATCTARSAPSASAVPCVPSGTELEVQGRGNQYHTAQMLTPTVACLAVNPGVAFTIHFANQDAGVRHNVAIFQGARMYSVDPPRLFTGRIFTGPEDVTYRVPALPPGLWTFHCDIHQFGMTGLFVVPGLVTDAGFQPQRVDVGQDLSQYYMLAWYLPPSDQKAHSVSEGSGVFRGSDDVLESGDLAPGSSFQFRFFAAGSYTIVDRTTGAMSEMAWPMMASRTRSSGIALQWAVLPAPAGFAYDVQVHRPGSGFTDLRTNTTAFEEHFAATGRGTYAFRARLRNTKTGAVSGWSPEVTVEIP